MVDIILLVITVIIQFVAPTYIAILCAVVECILPDSLPLIDEIITVCVAINSVRTLGSGGNNSGSAE